MTMFEGWFAPVPWSDRPAPHSALVIMTDPRAAVATWHWQAIPRDCRSSAPPIAFRRRWPLPVDFRVSH